LLTSPMILDITDGAKFSVAISLRSRLFHHCCLEILFSKVNKIELPLLVTWNCGAYGCYHQQRQTCFVDCIVPAHHMKYVSQYCRIHHLLARQAARQLLHIERDILDPRSGIWNSTVISCGFSGFQAGT
jgi:hypothetical protein